MVAHRPISKILVGHRPKFQKWLLTDQFQKNLVGHQPKSIFFVGHQPKSKILGPPNRIKNLVGQLPGPSSENASRGKIESLTFRQ